MKDIKTAENYLKEKYSNNNSWSYYPPSERTVCEIMKSYAEYFHKAKVESISDEELKKMFTTEHFSQSNGRYYRTRVERITGARMFKNKLLNDL